MAKIVIKMGAQVFSQQQDNLADIARDLHALKKSGHEIILVHGGGVVIDESLKAAGITPQKKDGLRITDAATMKVVQQVLDAVNADLSSKLTQLGLATHGFASHNTVLAATPACAIGLDGMEFDLGFVGSIESVDTDAILSVLKDNGIPLIAPLAFGVDGKLLFNVNADNVASGIAEHINADMLIFMSDVPGVIGANNIGVKTLRKAHCDHLTAVGTVTGGMLAKLHNAFRAAESGVKCVQIIDGTKPHSLVESVDSPGSSGTLIAC